jgi:hypothetical protein
MTWQRRDYWPSGSNRFVFLMMAVALSLMLLIAICDPLENYRPESPASQPETDEHDPGGGP